MDKKQMEETIKALRRRQMCVRESYQYSEDNGEKTRKRYRS
ncbi:hypothetical protein [Klebsiella variicola]|nr:hypothetical protein [Klebsiella variicola]